MDAECAHDAHMCTKKEDSTTDPDDSSSNGAKSSEI